MKQMRVGKDAVKRWWPPDDGSMPCFKDLPRSGRPPILGPTDRKAIKRQAKADLSTAEISMRRMHAGKQAVSPQTINRVLKGGRRPLTYQHVKEVRVLRDTNKKQRMQFASTFDVDGGPPLVFLDGKVFSLYSNRGGRLKYRWAPADAAPISVKGKQVAHLHFYAAISQGWKSSLFFVPPSPPVGSKLARSPENFSAEHYTDLMTRMKVELDAHFNGQPYRIIRDRASQHLKAEKSMEFSLLNLSIVEDYPAQCWDINAIEHAWAQLVRLVLGHRARTADGLRRVIKRQWELLPQSTIDKLLAGVPSRLKFQEFQVGHGLDVIQQSMNCIFYCFYPSI